MPSFKEMAQATPRIHETNDIKRAILSPDYLPMETKQAEDFDKEAFKNDILSKDVQADEKYFEPLKPVQIPQTQKSASKPSFVDSIKKAFGDVGSDLLNARNKKVSELTQSKLGSAEIGAVNTNLLGLPQAIANRTGSENAFTEAKANHPTSYKAGEFAGYFAPGTTIQKLVGNPIEKFVIKKFGGKIIPALVGNAVTGATIDTTQGVIEGDNTSDLLKRVGTGAAVGTGLGLAGEALGGVANLIKNKGVTSSSVKINGKEIPVLKETMKLPNVEQVKSSKIVPEVKFNEETPVVSGITQQPTGNIERPNYGDGSGKMKTSQLKTNTYKNADILNTPETQKIIDDISATYEVKPNEQSIDRATKELENNYDEVVKRIKSNGIQTAEDATASGIISKQLRIEAEQSGDYSKLKDWLETVQPKVTDLAQALQAISTWKKLTPEGALNKAQQIVSQVNRDGINKFGKNFKKVELSTDEMKFINEQMNLVNSLPEGRDKEVAFAKVKAVIADKVPSTISDKIAAVRNIALLGNSKTFTRNVVGNALMDVGDNLSNTVGGTLLRPLDNFMSKVTGVKTVGLPSLKTQGKGFVKGGGEAISDALGGLKLSDLKGKSPMEQAKMILEGTSNPIRTDSISNNKFEIQNGLAFKNKPMRILENAVNTSLAIGDKPFSQAYYDDIIRQLKNVNKTDVVTDEMKQIAEKVAQERTYQDANTISNLALGIKNLPKKIQDHPRLEKAVQIFVDSLLPYVKTPANILKRGLEFTPEGILEGVIKLGIGLKDGTLNPQMQREIIDRISRGLVGTGIIAGGTVLANDGILTGTANKDKDVANLETQMGKQPFSVKLGDKNISYNQYQPLSMPLGAAAQMVQNKKDGSDNVSAIYDSVSNALNYYADQPMLQSIQRFLGSTNDSKGIGQRVIDSSLELPKQFIPSALKQVAQLQDDTQRNTYSPNYLDQQLFNQIKSKIPELSKQLEPKVNTLGNDVKIYQGKNNAFNVFFNPGNTTTENATPVQKTILDVYNETGDKNIFPKVADKTITYKNQKYELTPKEYTEFQRYIGTETNGWIERFLISDSYINAEPKEKAKMLEKIINDVYDRGKKQILEQRGIK